MTNNLYVSFGIKEEEYYRLLSQSTLVILPLLNNTVSGLINIIESAASGTICLSLRYPFTEDYFRWNMEMLCDEEDTWVANIRNILSMSESEYCIENQKFSKYVRDNFSPHLAEEKMKEIINEFYKKG